jgi:hypothetical protein
MPRKKYRIALTTEERDSLVAKADEGGGSKELRRRANILLLSDESPGGGGMKDADIARALRCRAKTVERARKRCFEEGVEAALERRPLAPKPGRKKFDGRAEAQLVEIACSEAPEGHAKWSLRMLADRVVELEIVDGVSHTTVGRVLKKTR